MTDFNFIPKPIPEPLTILGTGVVLGAIPILKKEYGKRNKKKDGDN
ncbi:MAG: PEP-CTERM sorting domain-containing protein [Snowella sp.]